MRYLLILLILAGCAQDPLTPEEFDAARDDLSLRRMPVCEAQLSLSGYPDEAVTRICRCFLLWEAEEHPYALIGLTGSVESGVDDILRGVRPDYYKPPGCGDFMPYVARMIEAIPLNMREQSGLFY